MHNTLQAALDLVLDSEGGFTNHPRDPGGATNYGITQATLSAWLRRPASVADVQQLTRAEAEAILQRQYADAVNYAVLPAGLDYAVLDFAVNSGPGTAVKALQRVLGFPPEKRDGINGLQTQAATAAQSPAVLLQDLDNARRDLVRGLTTFDVFGAGWMHRIDRVDADALRLLSGLVPEARTPLPVEGQAKASGATKLTATKSGAVALGNVAATAAAVLVSAGQAAGEASASLAPYSDVGVVRWILLGLAVVTAAGGLVVAYRRTQAGATT